MNVFVYDNVNNRLEINEGEILLVTEFKNLFNKDQSKDKELAFKELTYIYLALDWKSPYSQYTELERHEEALRDSGLTEEEFNNPVFREACRKYRALQESHLSVRMLNAAKLGAQQFIDYFTIIADLNERDVNGKPVFDAKKHFETMSKMHDLHEELTRLENIVKKELTETSTLRAGAMEDFDPGDF